MMNLDNTSKMGKEAMDSMLTTVSSMTKGFQQIAAEATDYSKKSFEDSSAIVEKLVAAKSLDKAIEIQTDFAKSFHWFAIAADQGDSEALLKRDEIAQQLDQESLARARAALDAWQPKPADASANVVPEPQGGWGEVKLSRQSFIDRGMVITAQSTLTRLGYTPGPADGEIGPRTRDAVRAFQRSVGMPDTGDITPELIQKLDKTAS